MKFFNLFILLLFDQVMNASLLCNNPKFDVHKGSTLYQTLYSITRLNLWWVIWWWQFGCYEAWTPQSVYKFGWSIKIRSIHEGKFGKRWVGSDISWCKPWLVVKYLVCGHDLNLALKSASITKKDEYNLFTWFNSQSKWKWKSLNSLAVWLGDLYITVVYPILLFNFTSQRKDWKK